VFTYGVPYITETVLETTAVNTDIEVLLMPRRLADWTHFCEHKGKHWLRWLNEKSLINQPQSNSFSALKSCLCVCALTRMESKWCCRRAIWIK